MDNSKLIKIVKEFTKKEVNYAMVIKDLLKESYISSINVSNISEGDIFILVNESEIFPIFTNLPEELFKDPLLNIQYILVRYKNDNGNINNYKELLCSILKTSEKKYIEYIQKCNENSNYSLNYLDLKKELGLKISNIPIIEYNKQDYDMIYKFRDFLLKHGYFLRKRININLMEEIWIKIGDFYDIYLSKDLLDAYNNLDEDKKKYYINCDFQKLKLYNKEMYMADIFIYNNIVLKYRYSKEFLDRKLNDQQIEAIKTLYPYSNIIIGKNDEIIYNKYKERVD